MRPAVFLGGGVNDQIFNSNSPGNRDNCYQPYIYLQELLQAIGFDIHTDDIKPDVEPAFQLHLNARTALTGIPAYLLHLETPLIRPENDNKQKIAQYNKVFTWNDNLVDGNKFIKINFPNNLNIPNVTGFSGRPDFCCLIAGNKSIKTPDDRELYSERVKAIRWFEKNAINDFSLYGIGWESPARRPGRCSGLTKRLWRTLYKLNIYKPFPSYRGQIAKKSDALSQYKFCICYENVKDMSGYITEKIFDCFFSGCIPVYWGANNITDYIPSECFIDRRKFKDTAHLYRHLKEINEDEYIRFQESIKNFLMSEKAHAFSSEVFANTISTVIAQDLELLK